MCLTCHPTDLFPDYYPVLRLRVRPQLPLGLQPVFHVVSVCTPTREVEIVGSGGNVAATYHCRSLCFPWRAVRRGFGFGFHRCFRHIFLDSQG